MFKKLAQELKKNNLKREQKHVSLPFGEVFLPENNEHLKTISKNALDLYERESDIFKFKNMVLADLNDDMQDELMQNLFANGVCDPFEDLKLEQLADNNKFLKDLGLL